jgi:inosine-uridine nucleoside N-ribohydrolase
MAIPLIIDTDVALGVIHEGRPRDIDDGFVIIEALNLDAIDLHAVTTVFGNAPLTETDRVARELLALKKSPVPVGRGAAVALPASGPLPAANEAVAVMARVLKQGPARIAAIGPLTNIGLLLHHHPECIVHIEEIVVVAGRSPGRAFYIGDAGPVRDFNFENDVRATALLLDAGVAIVMAGFELTSQVVVTAADLDTIAAVGTPVADYLYRNSLAWANHWTREFPVDAGFHPWDSAALAWLVHPEWFTTETRGVRILPKAGKRAAWLECGPDVDGPRVTYLTGFAPGGAAAFVRGIVEHIY